MICTYVTNINTATFKPTRPSIRLGRIFCLSSKSKVLVRRRWSWTKHQMIQKKNEWGKFKSGAKRNGKGVSPCPCSTTLLNSHIVSFIKRFPSIDIPISEPCKHSLTSIPHVIRRPPVVYEPLLNKTCKYEIYNSADMKIYNVKRNIGAAHKVGYTVIYSNFSKYTNLQGKASWSTSSMHMLRICVMHIIRGGKVRQGETSGNLHS